MNAWRADAGMYGVFADFGFWLVSNAETTHRHSSNNFWIKLIFAAHSHGKLIKAHDKISCIKFDACEVIWLVQSLYQIFHYEKKKNTHTHYFSNELHYLLGTHLGLFSILNISSLALEQG